MILHVHRHGPKTVLHTWNFVYEKLYFMKPFEEEWFRLFEPFSMLEKLFCKYWTSIKMKIIITCVYKEYKIKMKMVQERWLQLKMKFLLGYNLKIVI